MSAKKMKFTCCKSIRESMQRNSKWRRSDDLGNKLARMQPTSPKPHANSKNNNNNNNNKIWQRGILKTYLWKMTSKITWTTSTMTTIAVCRISHRTKNMMTQSHSGNGFGMTSELWTCATRSHCTPTWIGQLCFLLVAIFPIQFLDNEAKVSAIREVACAGMSEFRP